MQDDELEDPPDSLLAAVARIPERALPFVAGSQIGRYRIVKQLGSGGMGVVFEAIDPELDRRVAIKVLRDHRATDGSVGERLRREAQALARLTHPNVVTVYDVGVHESSLYIVMQLVDGLTLDRWLAASRRTSAEIVALFVDAGRGLAAAHAAGIVHRDFKPTNVLVGHDGIARVSDFGLARETQPPTHRPRELELGLAATLTASGLIGTPAYMAPEQFDGGEITHATDQFSFCVALWEALSGTRPYDGATIDEVAAAVRAGRRTEDAGARIDRHVRAVLVRGLFVDPASRFGSMTELLGALVPRRRRAWRWISGAAIAACIAVAAVGLGARSSSTEVRTSRVIAVLGFKNATGRADAAWLATGLSEMFATELGGESIRIVPSETVARATLELHLEPGTLGKDTLDKVRADLGADLVVVGSYVVDDAGHVRVDLALQDTRTGDTTVIPATGTTRELFALVTEAGGRLRGALGVAGPPVPALTSVLPADPAAARLYAEGLAEVRRFDPLAARDKLEAAVRAAPGFPLAHVALAQVFDELGNQERSRAEARAALDMASQLPRREAHLVKARYFETMREWSKAIDEYRALIHDFPDDLEYGLGLAQALASSGNRDAAFATLDKLRALPPPAGIDPRIDLAEARAATKNNDFRHEQTAAATAARRGRETGALLLVGEARLAEAWASRRLGDNPRADRTLAEAREVFESLGYRRGIANTRNHLASVLLDRGDLVGARREAEAALALYVAVGDREGEHGAWSQLGEVLQDLGDLAGAHDSYSKALAIARAANDKSGQASALLNIGFVALHRGDAAGARLVIEEALPTLRDARNRYAEGLALGALGTTARIEGDLATARARFADAFATLRTAGDRQDAASVQLESAAIARISGDPAGARKQIGEARAEGTALQLDALLAIADLELARVAADEDKLDDAARDARAAAERFHKAGATDDEARARAFLAIVLASAKRTQDAVPELERATTLASKSQDRLLHIDVALATARVEAALGHTARALDKLRAISGSADTPLEPRLEARLREAQLTGSRAALDAVAHDATKAGLAVIADAARRR